MNKRQILINKFYSFSAKKQEDISQFVDLIQQDFANKPTMTEIQRAKQIQKNATKRVLNKIKTPIAELWVEFNQIKNAIAEEYANQENLQANDL